MELVQSLQTKPTLAMTQRMQASLRILQMNNHELSTYLAEKAKDNPYIELHLPQGAVAGGSSQYDTLAALSSDGPSLYGHVSDQIDLTFGDPEDRRIAFAFLEALEPSGWVTAKLETIAQSCQVRRDQVEAILRRLQGFEPAGIFARSLAECLRLQAEDAGLLTWEVATLIDNLSLLNEGRIGKLAALCDCDTSDIPDILAILRQFDPKPGQRFLDTRPQVFPPDLTARRSERGWEVELNRSSLPVIEISAAAAQPLDRSQTEARAYRSRVLSEARWLASTLRRRQTTLLRTGSAIVSRQRAFLDQGPGAMLPLSLADIGRDLDLHPSTISRAIAGRMIDTPNGALPLKAFFSRTFDTGQSGRQSQQAVLQVVRQIVSQEDARAPLSDTAIAEIAAQQGVTIARRTVAKFRGKLGIASSYARRRQSVRTP